MQAEYCGDTTHNAVVVDRGPGRWMSSTRDAFDLGQLRGNFLSTNSIYRWSNDDVLNINRYLRVIVSPLGIGTSPVLWYNATMITLQIATVNTNPALSTTLSDYNVFNVRNAAGSYVMDNNGNMYTFSCTYQWPNSSSGLQIFDAATATYLTLNLTGNVSIFPVDATVNGWMLEHAQQSQITILNDTFGPTSGSAVIMTLGNTTIIDSSFVGCNHGALYATYQNTFGEGAQPWNVMIANNTFYADSSYADSAKSGLAVMIQYYSTPQLVSGQWVVTATITSPAGGMGNITVVNNSITMPNVNYAMHFGGVQGLTVSNNWINASSGGTNAVACPISVASSSNVVMSNNIMLNARCTVTATPSAVTTSP